MADLSRKRVLLIGAGGLGCPAGLVLARSGVGTITVADDDVVETSNLQRQTLYGDNDVGRAKAPLAAARLGEGASAAGFTTQTVAREIRVAPTEAIELVSEHDLVIEGTDSFASKFLIADACGVAGVPVVQAGAVRWSGWALGSIPGHSACLRCVFEDLPDGPQDTCADVGVVGSVVGVLGTLQAAIALKLLAGDAGAAGVLWSYDGLAATIRSRAILRQAPCALCNGSITDTPPSRYVSPEQCAGAV